MQEFIQNNSTLIIIILLLVILVGLAKGGLEKLGGSLTGYTVRRYFFTPAEKEFYTLLRKILYTCYKYKYDIFPKVRLIDIFKSKIGKKGSAKIIQKHVDFLIVDRELDFKPVLGIEIDGKSHDDPDSKQGKSDEFKKELYESCGLPLLRFKNSESDNYRTVNYEIQKVLGTPTNVPINEKPYTK